MPWRLSYGVKFYIPDPTNLKEDYTRLVCVCEGEGDVCVREGGGVVCVREGRGVVCVGDNRNPCSAAAPRNS